MTRALALTLLTGCGLTINYVPRSEGEIAVTAGARAPEAIDLLSGEHPRVPFTELGEFQARKVEGISAHNLESIIQTFRERASDRGCHGLILKVQGKLTAGNFEGLNGTCFVYTGGKD